MPFYYLEKDVLTFYDLKCAFNLYDSSSLWESLDNKIPKNFKNEIILIISDEAKQHEK